MAFWNGRRSHRNVMSDKSMVNKPSTDFNAEVSDYNLWQLISEIRNLSGSINAIYAEYDLMESDTIIGSALNMYADNAVQVSDYSSTILDINSDDPQLSRDLRSVLERFNIEDRLWNTAYNTAKYGNKYWKIYLTANGKDIDAIEEIDDPSAVMDLYVKGEPKYFAFNPDDTNIQRTDEYELFDRNSFIHFMVQSGKLYDRIEIPDPAVIDPETNLPQIVKYQIVRGESMIEGVRPIYRILKSLEDSLLAARIAKSEYLKIYNIEGGEDLSPIESKKMIDKVKRLFDSHMAIDTREGQKSAQTYNQPRPFMDPIFNLTSNGRGAISVETSGGEFEVRDIADIEYFSKLKFSGLHIAPSMLAFEENLPSSGIGNSASAMIQQDIRFATFVKKLTNSIVNGVKDFLNLWLRINGRLNDIDKFTVKMSAPSIAEDMAKIEELKSRIESLDSLSKTISEAAPGVNTAKIMEILMNEYIPDKKLLNKLSKEIKTATEIGKNDAVIAFEEQKSVLRQLQEDSVDINPADDAASDEITDTNYDDTGDMDKYI